MKMKMARAAVLLALASCFSNGVKAANVLPQQHLQAETQKIKEKSLFLQAGDSKKWEPPWEKTEHHPSTRLTCGVTEQVGADTDKYEDCPAACPYFAQNRKDTQHCTFLCAPGAECGKWNPNKPIPDSIKNTKTCRGPKVAFCKIPRMDGTDTCEKCMSGYDGHDGHCYFQHWTPLIIGSVIFLAFFAVVVVWFVDLCCRPVCNAEAVLKAEQWRSRSKIIDFDNKSVYCTYETNLCQQDVAGPGMLLHFRFQLFFIIWPLCCALVWTALACFHNELFILGTRKFGTPRHNCILVAWGYETQQRLMWTKTLFLAIVYVGSFVSFTLFFVSQLRKTQRMNANEKTMKDFAVELKGLPEIKGDNVDAEKAIQTAVEKATGKAVVGVTICWNYSEKEEEVNALINKDLTWCELEYDLEQKNKKKPSNKEVDDAVKQENELLVTPDPTAEMNGVHKWMYEKERAVLGPDPDPETDVKALLEELVASESAFVIFNTSEDKDEALRMTRPGEGEEAKKITLDAKKFGFGEVELTIEPVGNEPANLNWHNFGDTDPNAMVFRFFLGFFKVYVPALLVWFFAFYCPYAYSLYNFNYDNGAELPGYYSIIFTIVVCGGNATMYVVCDVCCDMIGFKYKDTKQMTYMLMYLGACMINVFLDMIVTYYTAMKIMVGQDFRTYHGERLADITVFTEQFETYAMQRSLGGNTYAYAWPSTFFLCFVLEPFVTIMIPYYIGKAVIRSHKEIRGTTSEGYLAAFEFDLGRYADILLNVFLGILIFYFPGGYIWSLFFAMAFSHTFIYCFDHWRVLNVIPCVRIVSTQVDWWAQVMMCACCAVILACLVFKCNCESYAGYCMKEFELLFWCGVALTAHFVVHFLILLYVVPKLGDNELEDENFGMKYEAVAKSQARTWFSMNPIHCLRSKFIHKHAPHCRPCAWGKEHLLEVNSKIGCFGSFPKTTEEDYSDIRKSISSGLSKRQAQP